VASNGAVLPIISKARRIWSSRGASARGLGVALSGKVGILAERRIIGGAKLPAQILRLRTVVTDRRALRDSA